MVRTQSLPLVSIAIITYNQKIFLKECLDSIVNQASIFSSEEYVANIDTVIKKIEHNKYNLTNFNSTLWTKLRQTMTTNLEKYKKYK